MISQWNSPEGAEPNGFCETKPILGQSQWTVLTSSFCKISLAGKIQIRRHWNELEVESVSAAGTPCQERTGERLSTFGGTNPKTWAEPPENNVHLASSRKPLFQPRPDRAAGLVANCRHKLYNKPKHGTSQGGPCQRLGIAAQ
jgi:hypothetical protein